MIPRRPGPTELRAGAKLWGSRSAGSDCTTTPTKTTMKLPRFIPITTEGSALAYLDVETPSGMIVRDCKLMRGPNGGYRIATPSQKQLDRNGDPILDELGKPRYRNFVDFRDKATRDKFSAAVLDAVCREHPEVLT
jgi:hypothetical protein